MESNAATTISSIPTIGWAVILVIAIIVVLAVFVILMKKDVKTPYFSTTEKNRIQAESRELSDNQMRGAKVFIGSIRTILNEATIKTFPDINRIEKAYLNLLFNHIVQNLLDQFRIDLVRNHIIQKNEAELKEYTKAKADIYYMKIIDFLESYNSDIPQYDLKAIMKDVSGEQIYNLYYKSYENAKSLSIGY